MFSSLARVKEYSVMSELLKVQEVFAILGDRDESVTADGVVTEAVEVS